MRSAIILISLYKLANIQHDMSMNYFKLKIKEEREIAIKSEIIKKKQSLKLLILELSEFKLIYIIQLCLI